MSTPDDMKQQFRDVLLAIEGGLLEMQTSLNKEVLEQGLEALEDNLHKYYVTNAKLMEQRKAINSIPLMGIGLGLGKEMLQDYVSLMGDLIKNGEKMNAQLINENAKVTLITGQVPVKSQLSIEAMNAVKDNMSKILAELIEKTASLKQGLRSGVQDEPRPTPRRGYPGG